MVKNDLFWSKNVIFLAVLASFKIAFSSLHNPTNVIFYLIAVHDLNHPSFTAKFKKSLSTLFIVFFDGYPNIWKVYRYHQRAICSIYNLPPTVNQKSISSQLLFKKKLNCFQENIVFIKITHSRNELKRPNKTGKFQVRPVSFVRLNLMG